MLQKDVKITVGRGEEEQKKGGGYTRREMMSWGKSQGFKHVMMHFKGQE